MDISISVLLKVTTTVPLGKPKTGRAKSLSADLEKMRELGYRSGCAGMLPDFYVDKLGPSLHPAADDPNEAG